MANPTFTRTVLSSAIAFACYGGSAWAACPGTVTGTEAGCALGGNKSVTIDATGKLPFITVAAPGTGNITNAGVVGPTAATTAAINYAGDLAGTLTNSGVIKNARTGTTSVGVYIEDGLLGTLDNSGTIEAKSTNDRAYGVYIYADDLEGTLTNTGRIAATATGTAWNTAVGIAIYGDNTGDLTGSLVNEGTIQGRATGSGGTGYGVYVEGELSGTLDNSGLIKGIVSSVDSGGSAYGVYLDGGIAATGKLMNSGTIEGVVDGGTSWGYAAGIIAEDDLAGELTNSGTIRGSRNGGSGGEAYGIYVDGELSGTLDNSGLIQAVVAPNDSGGTAYGVYLDGGIAATGKLMNSGTIEGVVDGGTSWGYAAGIIAEDDLAGELTNSGTIRGSRNGGSGGEAYGIYVDGELSGTLDNSGLIQGVVAPNDSGGSAYGVYLDDGIASSGKLLNSGTIEGKLDGGTTWGYAAGIIAEDDVDGTLTNTGKISGHLVMKDVGATGPTVGGTAYGIYIGGGVNGTVDNSGTVEAFVSAYDGGTAYGLYAGPTDGDIINSGLISARVIAGVDTDGTSGGGAAGVYLTDWDSSEAALSATASLVNSGTIQATLTGGTWGSVYGVFVGDDLDGSLDNSGTITASVTNKRSDFSVSRGDSVEASAYGIAVGSDVNGKLSNSGTVLATASAEGNALSTSESAYAFGIRIGGDLNSEFNNSGDIGASATISGRYGIANGGSLHAYGLYVDDDLNGTIDNSGTISAKIKGLANVTRKAEFAIFVGGDSSAGTLTNSGTINGAVQLNGGILNLNGGEINGAITSVNALDVNIGGEHMSSAIDLAGALVDDFSIRNRGHWILDAAMVDVDRFMVKAGGRLTFAKSSVGLTEDVSGAGTVAVNAGVSAMLTGDYTQGAGGVFEVMSTNPDDFGQLTVSGTADLTASGGIHVAVEGLVKNDDVIENILSADTLTTGALTTTDDSLFYNFNAVKDGNTIDLETSRDVLVVDAVAAADLPYANGVATAIDAILNNGGASAGIDEVLIALGNLGSADDVAQAVAQLVPTMAGQGNQQAQQLANMFSNVVGNRIGGNRGLSAGDSLYEERHAWIKPFGGYAEGDERSGVPGFEVDTFGIAVGGDIQHNDKLMLGAGFAWSDSKVDGKTINTNKLDVESFQLVLYGNYDLNATDFVESYAIVGFNDNESRRDVAFGGLRSTALAKYDSIFARIYTGVGRGYRTSEQFMFTPMATLRYTHIDQDSYTESGAGVLNLNVSGNDEDSLILGMDGVGTYTFGEGGIYAMSVRAGIGYDVLTDQSLVSSNFTGGGGVFTTTGSEPDEFVYRAGFGMKASPKDKISVRFDYEFEGRSDYQSHGGSMNLRWQF